MHLGRTYSCPADFITIEPVSIKNEIDKEKINAFVSLFKRTIQNANTDDWNALVKKWEELSSENAAVPESVRLLFHSKDNLLEFAVFMRNGERLYFKIKEECEELFRSIDNEK